VGEEGRVCWLRFVFEKLQAHLVITPKRDFEDDFGYFDKNNQWKTTIAAAVDSSMQRTISV